MRRIKVAIDCDISHRLAAVLDALYGHLGFEFTHVKDFADPASPDDFWADVFGRFGGEVTLSADGQIAYKPHKVLSFIDNGFIAFFAATPWQHMPGHLKAAHLAHAWPAIEAKIREGEKGRCWRIPCVTKIVDGKHSDLHLSPVSLEPLVIPEDVLQSARQIKRSIQKI